MVTTARWQQLGYATSTISITNSTIYTQWITNTTAATSTTNAVWTYWNDAGTGSTWAPIDVPQATEEQLQYVRERIERDKERRRLANERAGAAQVKATALLMSLLSPEQQEDWEVNQAFTEVVASGHEYRLIRGYAGNVHRYEGGQRVEALCIHPRMTVYDEGGLLGDLPKEDAVVAQLLALRADEENFRAIANITRYRPTARLQEAMAA